jgi:RNA polymerase sigma-70 factor, ECF subfamily
MYNDKLNKILTYFARKLTRRNDVEDLIQQTYLKMLQNKDKFDGKNLNAWACTILKNEFINEYRKTINYNFDKIEIATSIASDNNTDELINIHFIDKYINELPVTLNSVFTDYLNGFKYEEIAQRHHIPIGTVKGRIFRARDILTRKIA